MQVEAGIARQDNADSHAKAIKEVDNAREEADEVRNKPATPAVGWTESASIIDKPCTTDIYLQGTHVAG